MPATRQVRLPEQCKRHGREDDAQRGADGLSSEHRHGGRQRDVARAEVLRAACVAGATCGNSRPGALATTPASAGPIGSTRTCISTAALVVDTMTTPAMLQPAMTPLPAVPAQAAKMKSASLA